jgi:hypothetical protein
MNQFTLLNSLISLSNLPKSNLKNNIKLNIKKNNNIENTKQFVSNNFILNNQKNNIQYEPLPNETLNKISNLSNLNLLFEFVTEQPIKINPNDTLFPICCVGKNRSQYLFYFLKKLQSESQINFNIGYPMSCDELTTIIKPNPSQSSVLSGFVVPYKSDTFSKSVQNILGFEVSRSIHPFDLIIKNPEPYLPHDLKNLESSKYKTSSFDIFDSDKTLIQKLFIEYYLNPYNIQQLIKSLHSISNPSITYICASPESYINLINLFDWMVTQSHIKNFSNTRIVYMGVQDIFQRSSVNTNILKEFESKIKSFFITI